MVHGAGNFPSSVTSLSVDDVTNDHVAFSWDPPGYHGDSGAKVEGYIVEGLVVVFW